MAKAVAFTICFVLFTTSVDVTAFAFTGEAGSDKNIVGITSLSDEIANPKVKSDATLEDIKFPENPDTHVTYQVEKKNVPEQNPHVEEQPEENNQPENTQEDDTEIVIEEVEEDVSASVEWTLDEERSSKADGTGTHYNARASIIPGTSNIVLYAEREPDAFKVSFNSNGGNYTPEDQNVNSGAMATKPSADPTKVNYKFLGWTTDSEATTSSTLFDFENTSITAATTLYAVWEPHDHSWAYAADESELCAYCTVDGYNCSYYGTSDLHSNGITINIDVDSSEYSTTPHTASVQGNETGWKAYFTSLPTIQYEYKETEGESYSPLSGDPIDSGYYRASITVDGKTAVKEYRIIKRSVIIDLSMDDYQVGSTPSTPELSGKDGDGEVAYYYKKNGADDNTYTTTAPTTPWGDYIVKAVVAETKNYSGATKTCDFMITPKERTETISVSMSEYKYGQDTAPTPSINPEASGLIENPSVTYKYKQLGSADEYALWTGDTTALAAENTYEMIAVIEATDSYAEYTTNPTTFNVNKGEWKVTAPTAKTGLPYNCAEQELVNAGSVKDGGKLLYSTNGTDYSESIPKAKNAGEYTVYYKVAEDRNHGEYGTKSISQITIAKADWNVTAPTAIAPSYTGSPQALVNAGVVKDADGSTVANKMLYSLTGDTDSYLMDIPTATEVGSYTVYYKVDGDDNHNEYTAKTMTATIEKISRTDMPTVSMEGYTYGQTRSIPTLSLSTTPSENPTVTYYYNTTESYDDAVKWENITATSLDAGTYYMFASLSETDNYRKCNTSIISFVISKAESTCTVPSAKQNLKYTGLDQELVTGGSTDDGTMKYCLTEGGEYSENIPVGKDAKEYTVYYKVVGDENHNDSTPSSVTVSIGKGEWNITSPVAKSGLTYNCTKQELVNAGAVEDVDGSPVTGKMLYSLTGNDDYSLTVPTADEVGTYTVYYKVVGDANHEDIAARTVTATIGKGEHAVTAPKALNPVYNGNDQVLISAGSCATGEILYSLGENGEYTSDVNAIKTKAAGTYTVYYKVLGNLNYNEYAVKSLTAKIVSKPTPTPDPPKPDPDPSPDPEPTPTPDPITPTPTPVDPNPVIPIEPKPTDTIPVIKLEDSEEENAEESDENGILGDITETEEDEQPDTSIKVRTMKLGEGNVRVDVETSENFTTPVANIETPVDELVYDSDIFTKDEIEKISSGLNARVRINVSEMDITVVPEQERAEVLEKAKSLGAENIEFLYFDITLLKQVGDGDISYIHEPGMDIEVSIAVPEALRNTSPNVKRVYNVLRIHDEEVENLGGDYNEETGCIVFRTGKFSTYVLAYADKPIDLTDEILDTDSSDTVAKAGNITSLAVILSLILLVGLGLIVFFAIRRRKKEQ